MPIPQMEPQEQPDFTGAGEEDYDQPRDAVEGGKEHGGIYQRGLNASVDLTSQPPGTAAGCGSSLAWWNRLTTTLSGAPGLLS